MSPVTDLSARQEENARFLAEHFGPLVGARLVSTNAALDADNGEMWPTLIFETDAGRKFQMELSRDPEGNGPGWAFIEAVA